MVYIIDFEGGEEVFEKKDECCVGIERGKESGLFLEFGEGM